MNSTLVQSRRRVTAGSCAAMEFGIYTFAKISFDPKTGRQIGAAERLRRLIEEIEVADAVGLDVFGIGEHHRADFAVSSPAVVLAAAAARTKRIRLTSAVTVLSLDEPIRVYQDFATLDLLSAGRAEIMVGRGAFAESFPLFGQSLDDYDELFTEKLDLLLKIRDQERVTWSGRHRAPLNDQGVWPRPQQQPLPIWIAVSGKLQSVVRAGALGLPLAIALVGSEMDRHVSLASLYRESGRRSGIDEGQLKIGINSHGFLAPTAAEAADIFYPSYADAIAQIAREQNWELQISARFKAACAKRGPLFVGSPDDIIEKILFLYRIFGNDRFLLHMGVGPVDHDVMLRSIELLGTRVAPAVRAAIANEAQPAS
jgi:probable LLM family oxidoreductase